MLDDDGSDCAIGVSGEVVVRGPHTMLGYWNKPEETAKALQNGWVYTGDAGIFDDEGYLYIVDRLKDMVVTGGKTFYNQSKTPSLATLLFRTCRLLAFHTMNGVKPCTPLLFCTRTRLRPRKSWSHTANQHCRLQDTQRFYLSCRSNAAIGRR